MTLVPWQGLRTISLKRGDKELWFLQEDQELAVIPASRSLNLSLLGTKICPQLAAPAWPVMPTEEWPLLLFYAERGAQVTFPREAIDSWRFLILFVFPHFPIVVSIVLLSSGAPTFLLAYL